MLRPPRFPCSPPRLLGRTSASPLPLIPSASARLASPQRLCQIPNSIALCTVIRYSFACACWFPCKRTRLYLHDRPHSTDLGAPPLRAPSPPPPCTAVTAGVPASRPRRRPKCRSSRCSEARCPTCGQRSVLANPASAHSSSVCLGLLVLLAGSEMHRYPFAHTVS
jgi:hypothetical protein